MTHTFGEIGSLVGNAAVEGKARCSHSHRHVSTISIPLAIRGHIEIFLAPHPTL